VVNGEAIGSAKTFKTDYIQTIPNAGMEDWNNDEGWPMPYASGGTAWWGNGNKAADMAGLVISESDNSTYSEGTKSAKLSGKQIKILTIDKVAPGNLFSGYFVGTVGTSGGKVNFGRRFTARPSAMKVDYKYTCGEITHNEGGPADDNTPHAKGDPDRCHIYVALGDWDYKTYGGTAECPVQVNTTDLSTLFDPNSDAVIAYGELVKGETVSDWTEEVIRLKYKDTTRRPTHIIISCASSKLGDYLTGSYNSTLWVDDFELIYDENVVTE
ncbi:MAG: PCMD domain-containing protein, partial [Rikenellaceae bacterium]|nr:PCMD domain-containing protein [Rikenellaceae bacterium]